MSETYKFQSQITEIEKINPLVTKILIKIAYEGLNRNNSFISRQTFDNANFSLPRCPIIGEFSETIDDFRGHGGKLEITDDNIKWISTTIPYGFIDVDTEITWQNVTEDDGTTRQYICATGYVWTGRYPELEDLITNSKSHSMEIEILSGNNKDINGIKCYEITEFIYSGFCILGDDVEPCFEKSSISAYSIDKNSFKRQFSQMVEELKFSLTETYNVVEKVIVNKPVEKWKCPHCKDFIGEKELYFNNDMWYHSPCVDKGEIQFNKVYLQQIDSVVAEVLPEGGNKLVPEEILNLLQKYSLTETDLIEKNITYTEFSIEDLETKLIETFQVNEDEVKTEEEALQFSLTSEQMDSELRRELAEIEVLTEVYWDEVYTYPRYYYRDHKPDEKIVIAVDEKNWYLVGFTYSVIGDAVEIDSSTISRYKVDYISMDLTSDTDEEVTEYSHTSKTKAEFMVTAKEKSMVKQFESEKEAIASELNVKFNELQEKYSALEQKMAMVDAELAAKLETERFAAENTIFESFSKSLTEEEMAEIKSKKAEFSLQEIEDKLCVVLGKKTINANTSSTFSVKVEEVVKPLRYSIVEDIPKKISDKSYADLIKTKE